jgi:hypothetical protein
MNTPSKTKNTGGIKTKVINESRLVKDKSRIIKNHLGDFKSSSWNSEVM